MDARARPSGGVGMTGRRGILARAVPQWGGRGLGGLRFNRRKTATLRAVRGFSFGGFRSRGIRVSVPSCGLVPRGNLSRLPLPVERSANPRGIAHPLGGGLAIFGQLATGSLAMTRLIGRSAPALRAPVSLFARPVGALPLHLVGRR